MLKVTAEGQCHNGSFLPCINCSVNILINKLALQQFAWNIWSGHHFQLCFEFFNLTSCSLNYTKNII